MENIEKTLSRVAETLLETENRSVRYRTLCDSLIKDESPDTANPIPSHQVSNLREQLEQFGQTLQNSDKALSSAINQINNLLQLSEKPTHSKSPFHYRKMQQRQMSENSGIADDDDIDSNQADESIPSSPISSPDHIHNGHDTDISKIMGKRKSGETLELSAGIKKKKSGFAPGTPMPRKQPRKEEPWFGPKQPPEDYVLPVSSQVAARVSKGRKGQNDVWILATVVTASEGKQRYEVEDAESGDVAPKKYWLHRSNVIPIPLYYPENLSKDYEFQKDSEVLGMFPQTSCFYKATVAAGPRRRKNRDYLLKFAEDEDEFGNVPSHRVDARYVLPMID